MTKFARFFLMKIDNLKYKLRENKKDNESEYVLFKKTLKNLKKNFIVINFMMHSRL